MMQQQELLFSFVIFVIQIQIRRNSMGREQEAVEFSMLRIISPLMFQSCMMTKSDLAIFLLN